MEKFLDQFQPRPPVSALAKNISRAGSAAKVQPEYESK
jgi:hypothetical protein